MKGAGRFLNFLHVASSTPPSAPIDDPSMFFATVRATVCAVPPVPPALFCFFFFLCANLEARNGKSLSAAQLAARQDDPTHFVAV